MAVDKNPDHFTLPKSLYIRVGDIDAEHERLIEIVNECIAQSAGGRIQDFEAHFARLLGYMAEHFANEEALMRRHGYDGFDWHCNHHHECVRRIEELLDSCRQQGHATVAIMKNCLHDLLHDIAKADLAFAQFINAARDS